MEASVKKIVKLFIYGFVVLTGAILSMFAHQNRSSVGDEQQVHFISAVYADIAGTGSGGDDSNDDGDDDDDDGDGDGE